MSEAEEEEMRARMRRLQGSRAGSRRPSVVDCTAAAGTSGRWSRRNSLAGNEFLKIEDEVRSSLMHSGQYQSGKGELRILEIQWLLFLF